MSDEKKDPKLSSDELKKQILGSISKPFTGDQTSRWIANMDDTSLVGDTALTNNAASTYLNVSTIGLVDKIFDEFQRYVYEYLRSPAGQNFTLNVGRPKVTDAPAKPQYGQVPVLCQGHLATATWAMIFVGQVGKVIAFIVPVEYIVGFKASQKEFEPFVEFKSVADQGHTDWRIDGHSISSQLLPIISKRFFGALIKVERQEAKHTDKFVMDPSVQEEKEPLPQRPETESDRVELMSEAVLQAQIHQNQQFQQNPQYQQAQSQPQYAPQPTQQPKQQPQQAPQYQQAAQQQPAQNYPNPIRPMPSPPSGGDPSEIESVTRAFDRNKLVIDAAIDDFLARMDLELDTLTKIGMKTIQVQDMAGAQRTIIRSAKLKEMRQRVNDLSNEWKAVVSES